MEKLPEQVRFERLERQYETLRLAVDDGLAPISDLEALAAETSEAAMVFATRRGWVLGGMPVVEQSQQPE